MPVASPSSSIIVAAVTLPGCSPVTKVMALAAAAATRDIFVHYFGGGDGIPLFPKPEPTKKTLRSLLNFYLKLMSWLLFFPVADFDDFLSKTLEGLNPAAKTLEGFTRKL